MKNTTFRKKALLSSVCMLLVALVALGSATFAWFSSNKVVTADKMSVKAAAAQGLVISNDNGTSFKNAVSFTQAGVTNVVLSPVSVGLTTDGKFNEKAFYPGEVKKEGGGVWTTADNAQFANWAETSVVSPADTGEAFAGNDYFAAYEVQIKSTGDAIPGVTGKIKYTAGNPDALNYIRFAVLSEDGKIIKLYGNEAGGTNAIISTDPETAKVTSETFSAGTEITFQTGITAPSNDSGDVAKFRVVVWFEGQDQNCVDNAQQAIGSLDLKFSY